MSGANGNVLGWVIEWRNSFRFYSGVVVEVDIKNPQSVTVYDYVENEEYNLNLKNEHIKMLKPFLQQFIKYKRKHFILLNESADEEAIHDYVLTQLERIGEDNKVMGIEKRIEIKRESLGLQKIKSTKSKESKGTDVENDDAAEEEDEEEDEEDEDEGSDFEDEDEDEEEEEDEEDEPEDKDAGSEAESSDEEEDDSEEESSDDEEEIEGHKVDMKVHILPYQDIRGFSVYVNSEGLNKIVKSIKKDYKKHSNTVKGSQPKLFYRDPEGDIINIMTSQDLKYAYRTAKGALTARSGSTTSSVVLKLFAELTIKPSAAPVAVSRPSVPSATGVTPRGSGGPLELNTSMDSRNAVTQRRIKMGTFSPPKGSQGPGASYFQAHTTSAAFDDDDDDDPMGGESEFKRYSQGTYDLESLAGSPEKSPSDRLSNNLSVTNTHSNNGSIAASSPKKPKSQYEVIWKKGEILGSGSFGEVFSGINLVNGDRIAVKEVSFQSINAKGKQNKNHIQQIKALQHEVKVLSSLDHPNIIKYLGTERTKYTLRIFLELATEGTVRDVINEFGPFPESLLRRYTIDIIEGLHFLHTKKFMHRDIKPTNLLISHGVVKLGDFGCSTATRDDDLTGSNAGHGTIIGTAVYMAPEVMRIEDSVFGDSEADSPPPPSGRRQPKEGGADDKSQAKSEAPTHRRGSKDNDDYHADTPSPYSPGAAEPKGGGGGGAAASSSSSKKGYNKKADIWSLGVTLCEMANGKSSFKNAAAAIYCVCVSKKYPTLPSHYSVDAHRFIDRCLVENPKHRASSTELRTHSFLTQIQSLDAIRAQTAAVSGMNNKTSTVKLDLPHDASFFNSQQFHTCIDGLGGSGPQGDRLRQTGDVDAKGGTADDDDDLTLLRADQKQKNPAARLSLTADSKANTLDRDIRTRNGSRGTRLSATVGATGGGPARPRPTRYDDSDEDDLGREDGGAGVAVGGRESPHYSSTSDDSLFSTTVGHTALHGAPSLMNSSNFHTVYARQLTSSSPAKPAVRTGSVTAAAVTPARNDFNSTFGAAITPAKNNIGTFPLTSTDVSGDAGSSAVEDSNRWSRWNDRPSAEEDDTVNSTMSHLFQR